MLASAIVVAVQLHLVLISAAPLTSGVDDAKLYVELTRLAENGDAEAQYHVGMLLNNGIGIARDPFKAFYWFERSAAGGDPLGAYKLGCYYGGQYGVVEPPQPDKALEYHLVAAEAGYTRAQYDVAAEYWHREEYQQAAHWWKQAADQGHAPSLYALSTLYAEDREGVPRDFVLAYAYFTLSQLAARGELTETARQARDEMKNEMSAEETEAAEEIVSEFEPVETELTTKAYLGLMQSYRVAEAAREESRDAEVESPSRAQSASN